jgi:hypothetical protein
VMIVEYNYCEYHATSHHHHDAVEVCTLIK